MKIAGRIKFVVNSLLDAFNRGAARVPAITRWQKERFLTNAKRFTPALGVDDYRGNRFYIRSDDLFVGGPLFMTGRFEVEKVDGALALLADRGITIDQILDVGANIGTTTIELLTRRKGLVAVGFEPEHVNFELLRQNVLANDLDDRVELHELALSDHDGDVTFELAPENPGDHRVRVGDGAPGAFEEQTRTVSTVRARRLDTLVEAGELTISGSTLLCMDVQGHEAHALDGATALREHKIPLLLEFWPYGLSRAGGLERLISQLSSYDELFLVSDESPRQLSKGQLADLSRDLGADHNGAVEILAIDK